MLQLTSHIGVKQAVQIAKAYVVDAFEYDRIERVGLEEISFDEEHDQWWITVGFSRPWDLEADFEPADYGVGGWQFKYQELVNLLSRTYKRVAVCARVGTVIRMDNRPI